MHAHKVIIVEGLSDKKKIETIIRDQVEIITTNGTISHDQLEELMEHFADDEVYILVDTDKSGEMIRRKLKRALPLANHLYINKTYKEVATAPAEHLAALLLSANIAVDVNNIY